MKALYKRIQYVQPHKVEFTDLAPLMLQFARHIPFENLSIIKREDFPINQQTLTNKIIQQNRGGLCYELNPLFFYFLREQGFSVRMIKGTVMSSPRLNGTHIAILLEHNNAKYLLDLGFGAHLALQPIPFSGKWIKAPTGKFRICRSETEGEFRLEKFVDDQLEAGYNFTLNPVNEYDLNEVKETITSSPHSPFNKGILLMKIIDGGYLTLTEQNLTIVKAGQKKKQPIDLTKFRLLLQEKFGIKTSI